MGRWRSASAGGIRCATAANVDLTEAQLAEIERALPLGYAAGERYSEQQWVGIQKY